MPPGGPAAGVRARRILAALVVALVAASVPVRLLKITTPLFHQHFRQTQTAITVWRFQVDGLAPLAYQTPLFGPPWRVPLEFPTFQITAYFVTQMLGLDLDVGCRVTALLYFYFSALLLWLLCRAAFQGPQVAWCAVLFYLWSPFNVLWSRNCMIDFASAAWALAYALLVRTWLARPGRAWPAVGAVVCGSLAYLTKVTTMAAYLPLLAVLVAGPLREKWATAGGAKAWWRTSRIELAGALVCLLAPALVGYAWVAYSDAVKAASPFTRTGTSAAMAEWNLGPWQQRLSLEAWWPIVYRVVTQFVPYGLLLLPLAGAWGLKGYPREARALFAASLAGVAAAVLVFFNLYVQHDYYLMAVSPLAAVAVGVGGHYVFMRLLRGRILLQGLAAAAVAASLYQGSALARGLMWHMSFDRLDYCLVGKALQRLTAADELVVVTDYGWSSAILYYARRRGFMLPEPVAGFPYGFLKANRFSVVVCRGDHPWLMGAWKCGKLLDCVEGFRIFRVSDTPLD